MRCVLAVALVAIAAPIGAQDSKLKVKDKAHSQPIMLEWEWTGDKAQNGATYRTFKAVCTAPMNPQLTNEVARGFSDNITRNEGYTMLSIAQGGTPQMGNWSKADKTTKNVVRDYVFKTGGRKAEMTVSRTSSASPEPEAGKGQLKHVKRGEETAVEALAGEQFVVPGVQTKYTLTYTSPPSETQLKKDGLRLTHLEWLYKLDGEEPRKAPWRTVQNIKNWKVTSDDKCTVEIVCEVASAPKNKTP